MIFIAVVLAVYPGMNWYVLARLYRLFALGRGGWFYVALLPLSLSGVAALALESRVGNVLTGSFSTVAMGWLGLCWLLLCLLLAQQALAWIVPLPRRVWGISWGTLHPIVVGDVASHDYLLPSPLATNGCTARLVEGLKVS